MLMGGSDGWTDTCSMDYFPWPSITTGVPLSNDPPPGQEHSLGGRLMDEGGAGSLINKLGGCVN